MLLLLLVVVVVAAVARCCLLLLAGVACPSVRWMDGWMDKVGRWVG